MVFIVFLIAAVILAIEAHKKKIVSGEEGIIGKEGVVMRVIDKQLFVRVEGELWEATSTSPLKPGTPIRVTGIHGLILKIKGIE
ncbi:MAG TPA: NfeD family protein [Gammaproteobacteria bacterium]|nr:NfeD family protein [Gammaproteobacteria bacterium]